MREPAWHEVQSLGLVSSFFLLRSLNKARFKKKKTALPRFSASFSATWLSFRSAGGIFSCIGSTPKQKKQALNPLKGAHCRTQTTLSLKPSINLEGTLQESLTLAQDPRTFVEGPQALDQWRRSLWRQALYGRHGRLLRSCFFILLFVSRGGVG